MAIIANKVKGVYAGVCHDVYSAERPRKSNDAQVLTMGARVIGPELDRELKECMDYEADSMGLRQFGRIV
jgi:ribose 5-phosphate isomerase B